MSLVVIGVVALGLGALQMGIGRAFPLWWLPGLLARGIGLWHRRDQDHFARGVGFFLCTMSVVALLVAWL